MTKRKRKGNPRIDEALLELARHDDSRKCIVLLGAILETPKMVDRLLQVLKPGARGSAASANGGNGQ